LNFRYRGEMVFSAKIPFQIPPYPTFLKGGWGDYLFHGHCEPRLMTV
jgi:hypothetical protein